MADVSQIEKTIEKAAEILVEDSVAYVKAHPNYDSIVAALGERALQALATGL